MRSPTLYPPRHSPSIGAGISWVAPRTHIFIGSVVPLLETRYHEASEILPFLLQREYAAAS